MGGQTIHHEDGGSGRTKSWARPGLWDFEDGANGGYTKEEAAYFRGEWDIRPRLGWARHPKEAFWILVFCEAAPTILIGIYTSYAGVGSGFTAFLVVGNLVWSATNTALMSARLALFYAGVLRGNESPVNWLLDRYNKRGAGAGDGGQAGSTFGPQKYLPEP